MIDLDLRANKFEKEQQKRREDAKRKREKEARLKQEATKREHELAELAIKRRAELEKQAEERALKEQEENILTGGIKFLHLLTPYSIDGEDDKVILPEECLQQLTTQDAISSAVPMSFELSFPTTSTTSSSSNGTVTHCGVREFSAPTGSIGLPKKIIDSIIAKNLDAGAGSDEIVLDPEHLSGWPKLQIKYVRLSKCVYAKLQPKLNRFFDVGPVKLCLEENLRFHAALTEGDLVTVWYRGKQHQLKVVELKPEWKGSLVNTDVEIDLELSEELQSHQKEKEQSVNKAVNSSVTSVAQGSKATTALMKDTTVFHKLSDNSSSSVGGSSSSAMNSSAEVGSWAVRYLEAEPSDDGADKVTMIKVKLPNGVTKVRRFKQSSQLRQIFLFIAGEAQLSEEQMQEQLVISTRFPQRNIRLSDIPTAGDDQVRRSIGEQRLDEVGFSDPSIAIVTTLQ